MCDKRHWTQPKAVESESQPKSFWSGLRSTPIGSYFACDVNGNQTLIIQGCLEIDRLDICVRHKQLFSCDCQRISALREAFHRIEKRTLAPDGNPGTALAGCAWANTCGTALAAAAAAPLPRTVRLLESIISSPVVRAVRATGAPSQQLQGYFERYLIVLQIKKLGAAIVADVADPAPLLTANQSGHIGGAAHPGSGDR